MKKLPILFSLLTFMSYLLLFSGNASAMYSFLLDKYSGAQAAYSLRQLDQDYLNINNSNTRTSIYPGLNQLTNYLNIDIIELQILFLSLSLASLVLSLTVISSCFA